MNHVWNISAPFRQFAAISLNATRKIVRQPLILLMTCACVILTGMLPMIIMFDFGEEGRLIRDGALALHFVFGTAIAIASASLVLHEEIKRGTAAGILCKPVRRSIFLLATYCGIVVVLLMFSFIVIVTGLLSVRMSSHLSIDGRIALFLYTAVFGAIAAAAYGNMRFKRPFVSRAFSFMIPALSAALLAAIFLAGHANHAGGTCCPEHGSHYAAVASIQWRMIPAGTLIAIALIMLASISVALSIRLPPAFMVSGCAFLFFAGLVSDYFFGDARTIYASLFYAILPNWQNFWMVDALSGESRIPWSYVGKTGIYAFLYLSGVLCLALISFRRTEIK